MQFAPGFTTFWMALSFFVTILPAYARHLGGSLAMVGLIGGSHGLVALVLRLPVGIWSDRLGRRKPFMVAGFLAGLLASLLFLAAKTPISLFWARAVTGIATSTWAAFAVFIAAYFPPDQVARIMGLTYAVTAAGQLASSASGAMITEAWGWKALFLASLITGFAGMSLLAMLAKERPAIQADGGRDLIAVGKSRMVAVSSCLGFLIQHEYWTITGFGPLVALHLGANKAGLGLLSAFNLGPLTLASLVVDKIVARLGERRTMPIGLALVVVGLILVPTARTYPALCLYVALSGLGQGVVYPLLMGHCVQAVPPNQRGTAMGFLQAASSLGVFLGPTL